MGSSSEDIPNTNGDSKDEKLPEEIPSSSSVKTSSPVETNKNDSDGIGEKPKSSHRFFADKRMATKTKTTKNDSAMDDAHLPVIVAEFSNDKNGNNGKNLRGDLPHGHRTLVAESETVAPKVRWEPEERHYHDKVWGVLYLLAWVAFLGCGLTLVTNANTRYHFHEVAVEGYDQLQTVRVISDHYQSDAQQCCADKQALFDASINGNGDVFGGSSWDVCADLTLEKAGQRRSQRHLQFSVDDDDGKNDNATLFSNSKFEPGDGMFDAFLDAPGITITLCLLALFCALLWVVLLRFFATPIVFVTEAIKVSFFLYLFATGIQEQTTIAALVALGCAIGVVAWDIYTYKHLIFAGKILSYAASSFEENTAMFCAFVPILGLYALHAYLFVLFYSKSFEVAEVRLVADCYSNVCSNSCNFVSPSYTTGMVIYISLAYLWSVLLFYTMRLSIVATIVGSWHFHPEHKPGVVRAVINTCTTSMGTLSVASLVQTIAEKLNRMLLTESLWKQCLNPIFWIFMPLYCICGYCIKMFILMLTKFCVILHVFSGKSWFGSAKKVFSIMKRHFKGGFVTEYASKGVLTLGSYVFSICIYFTAWVWMDKEFKTETFINVNAESLMVVFWLFFALFNIWYPVLGIYLLIVVNRFMSKWETIDPAIWVVPFAATFVGCISMMFFTYLAGIFLDTVDVLFLCFAIDRDNNVDMSDNEFAKLVQEGVPALLATPDLDGAVTGNDEEEPYEHIDVPLVVATGMEPIPVPETAALKSTLFK